MCRPHGSRPNLGGEKMTEICSQTAIPTPLVTTTQRLGTLVAVIVPFLGLLVAIYGLWGWGVSWIDLALLVTMYTLTGLGITIGYHRLFAHRSFQTSRPVRLLLAVLGSMAVMGPVLRWVAVHRRHHQYSDQDDDPHSPHRFGDGLFSLLAGWWHAHIGWMFLPDAGDLDRYVKDLRKDTVIRHVSRLFGVWIAVGLLIPAVAGGLIAGTWQGALLGFLWGGLVRVFFVHHVTWSVNSVCHLWGTRRFQTRDKSRNNIVLGLLALGEGWHNNHHAFATSARHGLRWWELDLSYLVICAMKWLGLAKRVRVPALKRTHVVLRRGAREHEPRASSP